MLKRLIVSSILCFSACFCFASTIITVETAESVQVKVSKMIHPQLEPIDLTEKVIDAGLGKITVGIEKVGYFIISTDNSSKYLFLKPNANYFIKLDSSKGIVIIDSELNDALENLEDLYQSFKYKKKVYYEWEVESFKEGITLVEEQLNKIIASKYADFEMDDKRVLLESVQNSVDAQILNFAWSRFNPNQPNPPVLPEFYSERANNVVYSKEKLLQNDENYFIAISTKRNWEVNEILKAEKQKKSKLDYDDYLRVVSEELTSNKFMETEEKSYHFSSLFIEVLRAPKVKDFDSYLNNYVKAFPNSIYYESINQRYVKKMALEFGETLFDIPVLDSNKKQTTLLEQYPNKIIYLDFWATWCGPCIKSFPFFNDLSRKYSSLSNQIVFVKLSIDQDYKKWQMYKMEERNDSYILPSEQRNSIMNKYQIYSVPRYILVDKNGYINQIVAPSPKDPNVVTLIDDLLKK